MVHLWAWGRNYFAEMGNGTTMKSNVPVQLVADNDWMAVAAGKGMGMALKSNGVLYNWGTNEFGQLGIGQFTVRSLPTQVFCSDLLAVAPIAEKEKALSIYPNPAMEMLHLQNTTRHPIAKIAIIDLTGQKVIEQTGDLLEINIQKLQRGMYLLQVTIGDQSYSEKFIKI